MINIILYIATNFYIIHTFQINCKTRVNTYVVIITTNI